MTVNTTRLYQSSGPFDLLNEIRTSFERDKYLDLEIYCDKNPDPILCHSIVMVALSPSIKNMIYHDDLCDKMSIILPEIDRTEVERFVAKIYYNLNSDFELLTFQLSDTFSQFLSQIQSSNFVPPPPIRRKSGNENQMFNNDDLIKGEDIKCEVDVDDFEVVRENCNSTRGRKRTRNNVNGATYTFDSDIFDDENDDFRAIKEEKNELSSDEYFLDEDREKDSDNNFVAPGEEFAPPKKKKKKKAKKTVKTKKIKIKEIKREDMDDVEEEGEEKFTERKNYYQRSAYFRNHKATINEDLDSLVTGLRIQGKIIEFEHVPQTRSRYYPTVISRMNLTTDQYAIGLFTSVDGLHFKVRPIVSGSQDNKELMLSQFAEFYNYYKLCHNLTDKDMSDATLIWNHVRNLGIDKKLVQNYELANKGTSEEVLRQLLEEKSKYFELVCNARRESNIMKPLDFGEETSFQAEVDFSIDFEEANIINDLALLKLSKRLHHNVIEVKSLVPPKDGTGLCPDESDTKKVQHELAKAFFKLGSNYWKIKGPKFAELEPYKTIRERYLDMNSEIHGIGLLLNIGKRLCMYCGNYFKKICFQQHVKLCSINRAQCNCGIKFEHEPAFRAHMKTFHSTDASELEYCKDCNFLGTKERMEKHVREDHGERVCEECGESFPNKAKYMYHYRVKHKERYCDKCDLKLIGHNAFLLHKSTVHRGHKFTCDICGKVCKDKTTLGYHRQYHLPESERKLKCPHCEKRCVSSTSLKAHVNSVHLGIRKWPCRVQGCDKAFTDGSARNQHEKGVHMGIKRVYKKKT